MRPRALRTLSRSGLDGRALNAFRAVSFAPFRAGDSSSVMGLAVAGMMSNMLAAPIKRSVSYRF